MTAKNAIVCDHLPPGLRVGRMTDERNGLREWHPVDVSGHMQAAYDAEINVREKRIIALDASIKYLRGWLAERRAKRKQAIAADIEIDTTPSFASQIKGYGRLGGPIG